MLFGKLQTSSYVILKYDLFCATPSENDRFTYNLQFLSLLWFLFLFAQKMVKNNLFSFYNAVTLLIV